MTCREDAGEFLWGTLYLLMSGIIESPKSKTCTLGCQECATQIFDAEIKDYVSKVLLHVSSLWSLRVMFSLTHWACYYTE